eukprot:comp23035_c2_seq2/m.36836 comp23035_c2_seq2/g.36836  ORF comp23035_c2_seq2/g.36836 comp23035_c2_seq2/m.36836 type:complete len:553 (-) comp23035_c2_seq2:78-1736(-)
MSTPTDTPAAGVEKPVPEGYKVIVEGQARALFPESGEVFYNPVQEFNRDLSTAVIRTWEELYYQEKLQTAEKKAQHRAMREKKDISEVPRQEVKRGISILEGLSATGLRAIRYAKELPHVDKIVANDLSPEAVELIKMNVEYNDAPKVIPSNGDCSLVCYQHRDPLVRFDAIDLDPYGSPSIFLDGAIQAVAEGGLMLVTCTDMAVLAGNHSEAGFAKYGAMPVKTHCCHELALRIVLQCLEVHAARYKRYIVPLISLSIDFYVRVFVRVYTSASEVKKSASKLGTLYVCTGCETHHTQALGKVTDTGKGTKYTPGTGPVVDQKCSECGHVFKVGGPMWLPPMHDHVFVGKVLEHVTANKSLYKTVDRIIGMLSVVSEELPDVPLFYGLHSLAGILHCENPPLVPCRSAILRAGYQLSESHCAPNSIKTSMPPNALWDMMRCWVKLHPVTMKNIKPNSPAAVLLAKEPTLQFDFTELPGAQPKSRAMHLKRSPDNPQPNWGPRARAKKRKAGEGVDPMEEMVAKRSKNQGRYTDRGEGEAEGEGEGEQKGEQ